jgi:tetratricopeptide (TPR) repeat protein
VVALAQNALSDLYARRAEVYLRQKKYAGALADLNQHFVFAGNSWAWLRYSGRALAPFHSRAWIGYRRRAVAHFHLGHYQEALADVARAVEMKPDDFSNLSQISLDLVASCPDEKFCAGMLALADTAIERTRGKARGYVARGRLYAALKQHDKARDDFEKAAELGATDTGILNSVAWFLATTSAAELRDPKRAVALATKVVDLKPKEPYGWDTLGVAHHLAGNFKAAVVALEESIKLAEGSNSATMAIPLSHLARHYANFPAAELRDPKRAVALAKRAVELSPKSRLIWNTLGVAQYRAGDYRAAVVALEKSCGLSEGGDSFDWFFLAMAHWRLGEREQARTWYDQAVARMDKHRPQSEELIRFRAEAAELLGVKDSLPRNGKEVSPR